MNSGSFWAMGGYARFVWPCFAFVAGVLVWNLWSAWNLVGAAKMRATRAFTMAAHDNS
jgi:heme exporter protein CcmD